MKAILEVFAPTLQHLSLQSCREINLAELAPCVKLESLRILELDSSLSTESEQNVSTIKAATFLPSLKSVQSDICLGCHSLLFEEKSTLIRLVLSCSHFVMNTGRDVPPQKRFKPSADVSQQLFVILNLSSL